ncbi:MAG: radical SAM protein [Deltaproteobacteria bacterium]|nr:radical SAM protein [Deltaproteobacteria bacterium]
MSVEADGAFTLILEPVKGCNLSCRYCYADTAGDGVMSRRTLETALEKTARHAEDRGFREIHILWHGGEPLLAGLGFFRAALQMLAGLSSGLRFHHYLQTNGLLLDPDFCAFFREHRFQIGLSLDGPQDLHDSMRVGADGQGSHARVLEKVRLLEEQGVSAGFNAVVTRRSLGREQALYRYFQGLGYGFRVNPLIPGRHPEASAPSLLQPGEYGAFLCRLFDAWTGTAGRRVMVSPLDLYLRAVLAGAPYECQQRETCVGTHLGVKPSGDAVLCCRFETHPLGNIHDREIRDLWASPFCEEVRRRAETLSDCHSCKYWSICHGGCPLNALVFSQDHLAKDPFCKDYQQIFGKIQRALAELHKASHPRPES